MDLEEERYKPELPTPKELKEKGINCPSCDSKNITVCLLDYEDYFCEDCNYGFFYYDIVESLGKKARSLGGEWWQVMSRNQTFEITIDRDKQIIKLYALRQKQQMYYSIEVDKVLFDKMIKKYIDLGKMGDEFKD